jgi:hypothetical protein
VLRLLCEHLVCQARVGEGQHFTDDRCELSGIAQIGNPG